MYTLSSYIKKVEGINGAVLINTDSGEVLNLDKNMAKELEEILCKNDTDGHTKLRENLEKNKWIIKTKNNYKDDTHKYYDFQIESSGLGEFKLSKLILELSTSCELECFFCDENNNDGFASCFCKRWNYEKKEVNYQLLINQFLLYNIQKIILLGGDPFYDSSNELQNLLSYLRENNYNGDIVIHTNGSSLNEDLIKFLSSFNNVTININLLGYNEEDYRKITKKKNIFNKVIKNIKMLKEYGIQVVGALLANNINALNSSNSDLQLLGIPIGIKYLYAQEHEEDKLLFSPYSRMVTHDYYTYQVMENTSCCLFSQIFISSDMKVYPCPFLRDFLLGDLNKEQLEEILYKGEYRKFWFLSKSKIQSCKNCKHRLQCLDCRAVEYSVDKNLYDEYFCEIANEIVEIQGEAIND